MIKGKKKIYIVDDDESVCRALKTLLMTFGFEAITFNSASSFFAGVSNNDPGCLILDIHMPGMDGWEMQKKTEMKFFRKNILLNNHILSSKTL